MKLNCCGVTQIADRVERLAHTHGKTWHTWHTDQDKTLPLGVPQLMMGFTADGQADPAMQQQRNQRLGIVKSAIKAQRADIQIPKADPGADGWQHGKTIQINDPPGVRIVVASPVFPKKA
nr:DUF1264 domain-containing protein [Pseudomonas syringae]